MKTIFFIVSIIYIISITGCEQKYSFVSKDSNITLDTSNKKELSRKHLDYWELFIQQKFDDSYEFELPYQRYIKGKEWYKLRFSTNMKQYKIVQKKITFETDNIAVVLTQFQNATSNHIFKDRWYFVNGEWYHKFRVSKLPSPQEQ